MLHADQSDTDKDVDDPCITDHAVAHDCKRGRSLLGSTTSPLKPPSQAMRSRDKHVSEDSEKVVRMVLTEAYLDVVEDMHSMSDAALTASICDEATAAAVLKVLSVMHQTPTGAIGFMF